MADKGWICLHRKIEDCVLWDDGTPFDGRSAWIDLILMANHEDREIEVNHRPMVIHRGQKFTSRNKLALRWGWTKPRLDRYINRLKSFHMIEVDRTTCGTLLTIVNYDEYQHYGNTVVTTNVTTPVTTTITTPVTQTTIKTMSNNNEEQKDGEHPLANPEGVPFQ